MEIEKLRKEQEEMRKKLVLEDVFDKPIKLIAGFDCSYHKGIQICAGVVLDYKILKPIEIKILTLKEKFPYLPGFLSYREAPAIIKTYHSFTLRPQILFIDGQGIAHPRSMGLASYVGIKLDMPSIGVAKSKLVGEIKEKRIFFQGKQIGWCIGEGKKIFISPGHKISLKSSLEIVLHTMRYRIPEPIRLAHIYAKAWKDEKF